MQAVLRIDDLPSGALDAAAEFHRRWVPEIRTLLAGEAQSLVVVLPPVPSDHTDWRRGMARDLARELAPARVNIVAGGAAQAVESTVDFLGDAPGVTGQYCPLHED